ncbi:hypothetical protein AGLY_016888, partial [Aphis glycines]
GISHRFPNPRKRLDLLQKWIKVIGSDQFNELPSNDIHYKKRICSIHFSGDCYSPGTKVLNFNAVPSLNLSNSVVVLNNWTVLRKIMCCETTTNSMHEHDDVVKKSNLKKKFQNNGMLNKIGIRHSKLLTPKFKSLYGTEKMAKFKECLKAAEKFSDKYLDSKIIGCMSSAAAIFIKLQLRETKNSPKGRRFTLEEKLLCLSLYKQSTKSYQLLSKLFILLARKTLSTLLYQIPISTGLDKKCKTLKEKEKYCVVLFDEVSLEPQLQYDDNVGCIVGFEDNGLDRTQRITNNFKQPISYTFCESSTKRYDLANQITNVLKAVHLSGLKVVDTICDQEYNDTFYEIDCGVERIKVVHLYDSPHLLKGIRNNLLSKNLMFTINGHQREACWKDIVDLYVLDSVVQDVKMLP